jgi:hypothetical protein
MRFFAGLKGRKRTDDRRGRLCAFRFISIYGRRFNLKAPPKDRIDFKV